MQGYAYQDKVIMLTIDKILANVFFSSLTETASFCKAPKYFLFSVAYKYLYCREGGMPDLAIN